VRGRQHQPDRIPRDVVLIATPVDLGQIISIKRLAWRVIYLPEEKVTPEFRDVLQGIVLKAKGDECFSRRLPHR
jgi:hypothetical protein